MAYDCSIDLFNFYVGHNQHLDVSRFCQAHPWLHSWSILCISTSTIYMYIPHVSHWNGANF